MGCGGPVATQTGEPPTIGLEDQVSRFFADVHPGWAEHTIADLLLHRTRLPTATWLSQYGNDPDAVRYWVLTAEPADRPAEPAQYLNRGYLVLGWVVEAVTGGDSLMWWPESGGTRWGLRTRPSNRW